MMPTRAKRLLGLDLGTAVVKAVELTLEGEAIKVTGMAQAPLKNPTEQASVIQEVLKRGAFHTKLTCVNVSGRLVSIKYITLPAMSDDEMKKALPFEADKYIPFEVSDAFLDGQRIGARDPSAKEMTAILAAAKRNLVLEKADLVTQCGLAPAIVDVDAFAVGNAFELAVKAAGGPPPEDSVAVVDIGASKTSVNILKGVDTQFTREIYIAGNDLTEALVKKLTLPPGEAEAVKCSPGDRESACREATTLPLEDLANEIRMSLEFYENQSESTVAEVQLCGGGSRLSWLPETLSGVFGKPVKPWNPFQNLQGEGPGLDPQSLSAAGGTMAVALGLASRLRTL